LAIGTLLPPVVDSIGGGLLDLPALVRYADGGLEPTETIYADVRSVPRGHRLAVDLSGPGVASPTIVRWFDAKPRKRRAANSPGAETEVVLSALEAAVQAGLPRSAPVSSLMSGGLDSTVITSIAARSRPPGAGVRAYCHIPAPGTPDISPFTSASDEPWATAVADSVGGLDLELVDTPMAESPVGVLREVIDVSRNPPLVPANEVWLADIVARIKASGSPYVVTGATGNAMFSYGLNQPLALVLAGEIGASLAWVGHRRGSGVSARGIVGRMASPLRPVAWPTSLRPYLAQSAQPWASGIGLAGRASRAVDRRTWLRHAATGGWGQTWAALAPELWWDDPFTDPILFDVIASLPVAAWLRGGHDRSLARRVASRVLPAAVATREGRGGQGADLPARLAHHQHELRDAIDSLDAARSSRLVADTAQLHRGLRHALNGVGPTGAQLDNQQLAAHLWARTGARVVEAAETARRHELAGRRYRH
jgi:hypothetical protein